MQCPYCYSKILKKHTQIEIYNDFIEISLWCYKCKFHHYTQVDSKEFKKTQF